MEDAYLRRIGLAGPAADWRCDTAAPAETLRAIATAHLATVPFENLAIHAGEPARADPDAILAKLVRRRRGGICYELNGGLGWLLERLGWRVAYHAGRVIGPRGPGLPLGHLALVVAPPGPDSETPRGGRPEKWLVDVGFGGDMVLGPVAETAPGLMPGRDPEVPVRQPSGAVVDYLLETRQRPLTDFAGMAWWHSTSVEARFTQSLICSVTREGRRHTLAGRRLKVTDVETGAVLRDRSLAPSEVVGVYRETYGIELATEPVAADFSRDHRQSVANGSPR